MSLITQIQQGAIVFIKKNKHLLIEQFASKNRYSALDAQPISIFMAGSPGAGKTEFSKRLLRNIHAVRIDADEIKKIIPQYTGKNSDSVQGASALGVEYLYDYVLKKNLSMLLDGTFADYQKARMNVLRSLHKGRYIEIFYLYQNPIIAWRFTKEREAIEGRMIPKKLFIHAFFQAKENVQKIKEEFGDTIKAHLIIKNHVKDIEEEYPDIQHIDKYLKMHYSRVTLAKKL